MKGILKILSSIIKSLRCRSKCCLGSECICGDPQPTPECFLNDSTENTENITK